MPDIGQPWNDAADGRVRVYANAGTQGRYSLINLQWVCASECCLPAECVAQLRALPNGTVIDIKFLPEIVIVKYPPAHLDDSTFEALLEKAEWGG